MICIERKMFSNMKKSLSAGLFLVPLLFFEVMQLCFCKNLTCGCPRRERAALLQLKQSFNDPSNRLVSWTGDDCCRWKGVTCYENIGHVAALDLRTPSYSEIDVDLDIRSSDKLSSPKVDSCLLELKYLAFLDLSGNDFQHSLIPQFFGSFKHLKYLGLSGARFQGRIPHQLGNLTNLQVLELSGEGLYANNLQWVSKLSSLQRLDMSFVNLSKALDLTQVLNSLPSLLILWLDYCEIQNTHLPWNAINSTFLGSIQTLSLRGNSLSGPLPIAFQNMTGVRKLYLSDNHFKSIVPLSLVNRKTLVLDFSSNQFDTIEGGILSMLNKACSLKSFVLSRNSFLGEVLRIQKNSSRCLVYDLEYLDLTGNKFGSNMPNWLKQLKSLKELYLSESSFYGPISTSFRELSMLRSLDLSSNQLSGTIPPWLGRMRSLEYLHLSLNQLNGIIPQSLGRLSMLKLLDLSNNQLGGNTPQSLGTLSMLKQLYLSDNLLNGAIPSSLGKLSSLEDLYLSRNQLNGLIPQSLGRLSTLKELDLSNNTLNESIPESLGRLLMLRRLDLSYNQLSGVIPLWLGKLSTLENLHLSHNQLNGSIPESLGQLVNLQELDISSNSLEGIVSELHFANLSSLKELDISSNHLTLKVKSDWIPPFSLSDINMSSCIIGTRFPPWIQTQKEVGVLDLSNASIYGAFPTWLCSMSLYHLDLSTNQITGCLPTDIDHSIPNIRNLILGNNLLNGFMPNSLCELERLEVLDLSRNKLSGEVSHCWRDTQRIYVINLSHNELLGTIPNSFGHLSYLKRLHVNENNLKGEIPVALRNCKGLELLDLGENKFSGPIPTWIGESLLSLRILRLRDNVLNGNIPSQLCKLFKLQILDLAHNNVIGRIPRCFCNLTGMTARKLERNEYVALVSGPISEPPIIAPTSKPAATPPAPFDGDKDWNRAKLQQVTKGLNLEYTKMQLQLLEAMDLSSNNLVGVIPEELCLLSGLRSLNLSHNHLSGNIPNKIGGINLLESLDLSNNQLYGAIPQSMSNLTSLSHLNLSHNNLSGKIPKGNQLQTLDDPSIYADNFQLCGAPLPKKCPGDDDSAQPPTSARQEDEDHEEDKKEQMLFYFVVVAGYATGLWAVIGTLAFKRNWRVAYFRLVDNTKEWILAMMAVKVARLKKRMQQTSTEE